MTVYRRISTPSFSASAAALGSGRTLKPIMTALGGRRQRDVGLRDRAGRAVNHFDFDLGGRQAGAERIGQRFDRALHVALDDHLEFLDLAGRIRWLRSSSETRLVFCSSPSRCLDWRNSATWRALASSATTTNGVPGLGHAREAEDFHRGRRSGLGHALAADDRASRARGRRPTPQRTGRPGAACLPGSAPSRPDRGRDRVATRPPCRAPDGRDWP